MIRLLLVPALLQMAGMAVDEGWFHRRRGLPAWERWGHPVDTLSVAACYLWLAHHPHSQVNVLAVYSMLAVVSCALITKDEFVHSRHCRPGEMWLHAALFILHPIVFAAFAVLFTQSAERPFLQIQIALTLLFAAYQLAYWNIPWLAMGASRGRRPRGEAQPRVSRSVNNAVYATLGSRWYEAKDDPVALLRAEAALRNPWVGRVMARELGEGSHAVLDIGCGAGFLSNDLAARGHRVIGLDLAEDSLRVAARHDGTRSVDYRQGDARALPFSAGSFEVVTAMDFLEHVEEPDLVIAEAARVLKPSGLFFFHTFNRNWLAWLLVIKGVEWFVRNTPRDMHLIHLFLKPHEVETMCRHHGLAPREWVGSRPRFDRSLLDVVRSGVVPPQFSFVFTSSMLLGYSGWARR